MAQTPIPNKNVQIRRYPMKAGEDPVEGAAIYLDTNGDIVVCGADPAVIGGITLHDKGADLEIDPYSGDILCALAYPGSTFWMSGSSTFTQAHEGQSYGIAFVGGICTVDLTETTNKRIVIEKVDLTRDLAEVHFVAANRQFGT